jgi:hypothetical protein
VPKPSHIDLRRASIRAMLRDNPEGMTALELAQRLNTQPRFADTDKRDVRYDLSTMPDAYIDRWVLPRGTPVAIWCVVVPPEHCPRPTHK